MTRNRTMQRYLKTLSDMQRKGFKSGRTFIDVGTSLSEIAGDKVLIIRCWATHHSPCGKKTRLRVDLFNNATEEDNEREIYKLNKFINN